MDDFDRMLNDPDPQETESLLKKLEAKALAEANQSFNASLGHKVWRTKDGRYINFSQMEDKHLMNSYNLVEKNITKYLKKSLQSTDEDGVIATLLNHAKNREFKGFPPATLKALGDQLHGYYFLYQEINERGLYQKLLTEAAEDAFNVFDDIINSKPNE
jgi:hypothetical protein